MTRTAQNLGNLGNLAYQQGVFAQTLNYLFRTLKVFEELGDKTGIVTQLGNIGNIYHQQANYKSALHYDSLALHMRCT